LNKRKEDWRSSSSRGYPAKLQKTFTEFSSKKERDCKIRSFKIPKDKSLDSKRDSEKYRPSRKRRSSSRSFTRHRYPSSEDSYYRRRSPHKHSKPSKTVDRNDTKIHSPRRSTSYSRPSPKKDSKHSRILDKKDYRESKKPMDSPAGKSKKHANPELPKISHKKQSN